MNITPDTKVHDLLEAHPHLLDHLASLRPEYAKLRNPVLRNTVARVASLSAVAEMGDMDVDALIASIERQIALHNIHAGDGGNPPVTTGAATSASEDAEGRARRQEALKAIIRTLHEGASVDDVKAEFAALTSEIDATEIAAMEQALIAEGMPVEEVQRLCDVHVSVFRDSLEATQPADALEVAPGHPVDTYRRENAIAGEIVAALRCSFEDAEKPGGDAVAAHESIAAGLDRLLEGLTAHYTRKENQLFPLLERHGIEGPTKVMWALDDEIRGRVRRDLEAARSGDRAVLQESLPETLGMVEDMVYKEEKILLPTALGALSQAEWESMAAGEAEIGFAWIEPPAGFAPSDTRAGSGAPAGPYAPDGAEAAHDLPLTTGALTLDQIDLMVRALPFDVTYVDEHDRVRFYSEGDRVFPRSPAAIGREVRNCHPPKSVDKVERILVEFKAGTKDLAEFWIELGGRFVHIRYFALRDGSGAYRGCLEVVQDATRVRALEGERRLVDW